MRLTEASLRGLDVNSRSGSHKNLDDKSIAERSINFMQQRQSTASVGSRVRRQGQAQTVAHANDIFGTPS